ADGENDERIRATMFHTRGASLMSYLHQPEHQSVTACERQFGATLALSLSPAFSLRNIPCFHLKICEAKNFDIIGTLRRRMGALCRAVGRDYERGMGKRTGWGGAFDIVALP